MNYNDDKLLDIITKQFLKYEYISYDSLSIQSEINDEKSIFSISARDEILIKSDSISLIYTKDEQSIKSDSISETQGFTFQTKKRKRDLFEITKKGRRRKSQKKK